MKVITPQWLKSGGSVSPGFIRKYARGDSFTKAGWDTLREGEGKWFYDMLQEAVQGWQLQNWTNENDETNFVDAATSHSKDQHLQAYSQSVYERNKTYTSKHNDVQSDINTYVSQNGSNLNIDQIIENYNSDVRAINAYWYNSSGDNSYTEDHQQLGNKVTYFPNENERVNNTGHDFSTLFDTFAKLYATRQNENTGDVGNVKTLNTLMGSTQWHRRADWWEGDFEKLQDPNKKKARIFTITIGNKSYYVYKKKDGQIAQLKETDKINLGLPDNPKDWKGSETPTATNSNETTVKNGTLEKKQEDQKSPINTGKPAEFPAAGDKDPFMIDTYPAEQMFRLGQILSAAQQQFNLKAQERVPLKEPMPILYKQGQYYATNQALEQQKASAQNTLRNQSNSTSDLAVGNATMTNGTVNLAQQIGTQQAQNIQQTHNQDVEHQMKVDQYNNKQEQDIWNENEQNLVAGQNMYLKALEELLQNRTAAIQQTEENLSTHYHKKWMDNNLDAVAAGHFAQQDALQKKMQDLQQQYQNAKDFTKSSQFQQLVDHIKANFNNYQQQLTQSGNDAVALAKILWNNADDPQAISLKSQFDTKSANTIELLKKQMNDLYNQSAMNNNAFSYRQGHISNEFGIYPKKSKPSPIFNVPIAKKGTKVDWYEAFSREHRKAQERHDRNNKQANDRTNTNLNKQLDRISKEELVLLRSIFK